MEVNLEYADHWLRKASAFSLPEAEVLEWALLKDEETRSEEAALVRSGLPQGEALTEALLMTKTSWTVGPTGNSSEFPPSRPDGPPKPSSFSELPPSRPKAPPSRPLFS